MFLLVLFLRKRQQKPISDTVKQKEAQAVVKNKQGEWKRKQKEGVKLKLEKPKKTKQKVQNCWKLFVITKWNRVKPSKHTRTTTNKVKSKK